MSFKMFARLNLKIFIEISFFYNQLVLKIIIYITNLLSNDLVHDLINANSFVMDVPMIAYLLLS